MPWVYKDANGAVQAVYGEPVEGCEEVAADDPGVRAFLQANAPSLLMQDEWLQSDLALARVLEDLVQVLIEKKVLLFTDFPKGAQQKLLERRGMREEFSYVDQLFSEEDEKFGGEGGGGGFL